MNKLRILAVFVAIITLTAVSGTAKKPAAPDHSATQMALFGAAPDGTADIAGEGVVGTNVWTYSPQPITLYLTDRVAEAEGSKNGFARCLKKNGPEGGRPDFFFDCTGTELNTCAYRLVVRDGIYDRKNDVVVFDLGSVLLDREGELVKEGTASFSIEFFE
jgi:hypothetical protein